MQLSNIYTGHFGLKFQNLDQNGLGPGPRNYCLNIYIKIYFHTLYIVLDDISYFKLWTILKRVRMRNSILRYECGNQVFPSRGRICRASRRRAR